MRRMCCLLLTAVLMLMVCHFNAFAWSPVPIKEDPLVYMPGTQPLDGQRSIIESPNRCTNCHGNYDQEIEPAYNWQGSMMAQAARDFLFYSCMTVSAQDSIWAVGTPNALDICERCHFPKGWLEGRSDPPNASAMQGADFDGIHCDVCHSMYDPFFETTFTGERESDDPLYWDEANNSGTLSQPAATETYYEDARQAAESSFFTGGTFSEPYFIDNLPPEDYTENASGQFFVDDRRAKRASFADADARHDIDYSRYHKSKYFCSTCHDVSNPVLANIGDDPAAGNLTTELNSAFSYYHVERTFSEFMLSAYGKQGGSAGIGYFAPDVFSTSHPDNAIASCQDCHMADKEGQAARQRSAVLHTQESAEHPETGLPVHDMSGGNAWVSTVLASTVPGAVNFDEENRRLLGRGAQVLTLDFDQGLALNPQSLLATADRAMKQLHVAADLRDSDYDRETGLLTFKIQNQTGHKLITGFPEGRRMYVNIKAYDSGDLVYEVNPYDYQAGTLKGLKATYDGQDDVPDPAQLLPTEIYEDELVYEMKPTSALTGEDKTFHFALATGRYKDNRIPPKGFDIDNAATRICVPVKGGADKPDLFSAEEYAGGYDQVAIQVPAHADNIVITLYYQTTSREYIEFLRDEINGNAATLTLDPSTGLNPAGGTETYIIQSDPFFTQLKAWGDTLWQLWLHNMNVTTAAPYPMVQLSL